jgi:hypothetical protein
MSSSPRIPSALWLFVVEYELYHFLWVAQGAMSLIIVTYSSLNIRQLSSIVFIVLGLLMGYTGALFMREHIE